jgi:hypothetical protein
MCLLLLPHLIMIEPDRTAQTPQGGLGGGQRRRQSPHHHGACPAHRRRHCASGLYPLACVPTCAPGVRHIPRVLGPARAPVPAARPCRPRPRRLASHLGPRSSARQASRRPRSAPSARPRSPTAPTRSMSTQPAPTTLGDVASQRRGVSFVRPLPLPDIELNGRLT